MDDKPLLREKKFRRCLDLYILTNITGSQKVTTDNVIK